MKNILNWRAALSPSAHLLNKCVEFCTKVFRRVRFWTFFLSIFSESCTLLQHQFEKITKIIP